MLEGTHFGKEGKGAMLRESFGFVQKPIAKRHQHMAERHEKAMV
jgi:hypothetical protein